MQKQSEAEPWSEGLLVTHTADARRLRAERRRRGRKWTHFANDAHLFLLVRGEDPGRVPELSVLRRGETWMQGGEEEGEWGRTHMVR